MTTFWLIEGNYRYRIEKNGAVSPFIPFTVVYSHDYTGEVGKDPIFEYKLSKVMIKVGDHYGGGHNGYLVRVYNILLLGKGVENECRGKNRIANST